jgi:predicted Zn-dependent protease
MSGMKTNDSFTTSPRRVVIALGVCAAAVLAAGCATDKAVISQAADVHTGLQPAVMDDPQLSSYLQQVGQRIIAAAVEADKNHVGPKSHFNKKEQNAWMFSQNMKFHLVNSKTLNAFTTGGEHMYIYNQLFQTVKTEDELAAVMAHEYAHVYCRHVEKGMNRQMVMAGGTAAVGLVGSAAAGSSSDASGGGNNYVQLGTGLASAAMQFVGMGFTRNDEAEADKFGFYFYTHAGWEPNHFADFFKAMIEMGYDKTPEYMSDHPTLANRVQTVQGYVAKLPPDAKNWSRPPIAGPEQFRALQSRAAELSRTMPNDESLAKAQKLLNAFPSCVSPAETPQQVKAAQDVAREAKPNANSKKKA